MPLNKVFLLGNLTREPELRYTPGGAAVCEFGMAMNRTFMSNNQQKEEVCFVDIVVWGKTGELCQRYLNKGSQALIEGRLQYDQWEDKNTGRRSSRLRVVADNVQFVGAPRRDEGGAGFQNQGGQNPGGYRQQQSGPGGYAPRQGAAPQQGGPRGNYGGAPSAPPMPEEAFNPDSGDDDIPF